jgi:hypothetical protein
MFSWRRRPAGSYLNLAHRKNAGGTPALQLHGSLLPGWMGIVHREFLPQNIFLERIAFSFRGPGISS